MFNLIMSYDDADWQVPTGQVRQATFPLARFLEYTTTKIEEQFNPVSPSTLARATGFPTVFMSEFQANKTAGGGSLSIRVGSIFNLSIEQSEIHYHFVLHRDFGNFQIPVLKPFENAFEMGKLEAHRTHWAIKDRDLVEALRLGGVLQANEYFDVAGGHAAQMVPPPPAPPPIAPVTIIDNLQGYMEFVLGMEIPADHEVFYRGHSDSRYKLEPSLFRKSQLGEYRYLQNESEMARELLTAQASAFATDEYMLDKLVRMQHFGLPTRLLDVTSNPLVGLYFCCSNAKVVDGVELDGEVIMLTTNKSQVRFFDSDTVSCIANLSLLDEKTKNRLDTSKPPTEFNALPECEKLLHFIRREKPYFLGRIVPSDLESIQFVRGRSTHERITSQSGAFLIFGKDAVLPETGRSSLQIKRVTVRNKGAIMEQLAKLNIKSSTIYPGLEKTTAEIAKKYEVVR